jgi:ribosomal protein L12E/L44/L45/RPP1/RPP2
MNANYIKEDLDESNDKFLKYVTMIDSAEILQNNRGMMFHLIPNIKLQKLLQWYESFSESENYQKKENRDKLESICSRFYEDGTLKILYKSLRQLITMPYTEPDKVSHEKDIKKMIKKVSIYIQQRLTDSDKELFELFSSDLDEVTKNLSDKIDSLVLASMGSGETETEDEPEGSSNDNTEDEPEKEKKMSEYYRRRLSKKIREMVRTAVIEKKIKKFDRKA